MSYHAHLVELTWVIFKGDDIVLVVPSWLPFSVVNSMVRDLNRLDVGGLVSDARLAWEAETKEGSKGVNVLA